WRLLWCGPVARVRTTSIASTVARRHGRPWRIGHRHRSMPAWTRRRTTTPSGGTGSSGGREVDRSRGRRLSSDGGGSVGGGGHRGGGGDGGDVPRDRGEALAKGRPREAL